MGQPHHAKEGRAQKKQVRLTGTLRHETGRRCPPPDGRVIVDFVIFPSRKKLQMPRVGMRLFLSSHRLEATNSHKDPWATLAEMGIIKAK